MVEAHGRVYTHSIFCIHNQSKEIHIHIYTWSSYIFQLVLCIFTLGLIGVSYSSVFFPKLNEIINSKISIRIGRSCGLFFRNSKVKPAYHIKKKGQIISKLCNANRLIDHMFLFLQIQVLFRFLHS